MAQTYDVVALDVDVHSSWSGSATAVCFLSVCQF